MDKRLLNTYIKLLVLYRHRRALALNCQPYIDKILRDSYQPARVLMWSLHLDDIVVVNSRSERGTIKNNKCCVEVNKFTLKY